MAELTQDVGDSDFRGGISPPELGRGRLVSFPLERLSASSTRPVVPPSFGSAFPTRGPSLDI